MQWHASVISSVSFDTEPTILLSFNDAKYLFNAGENTNRALLQSNGNLRKTQALFFTQSVSKRLGGLPGLVMTMADGATTQLDVIGPPGLLHFIASMRFCVYRPQIGIYPTETFVTADMSDTPNPVYKDNVISVYSIPIIPSHIPMDTAGYEDSDSLKRKRDPSPETSAKRQRSDLTPQAHTLAALMDSPDFSPVSLTGELADEWRRYVLGAMFPRSNQPRKNMMLNKSEKREAKRIAEENANAGPGNESTQSFDDYQRARPHAAFFQQLPEFTPGEAEVTLAYVVVGPRVRGKFDDAKAKELGIQGRDRGRLTKGETVTIKAADGSERVVMPEDVIGASENPSVTIILDIPTPGHIPPLVSSFSASPFYSRFCDGLPARESENLVRTVFHTLGDGVLEDPRYIDFMNKFGPDVQHVVSSKEHSPNPVTFTSYAYTLLRLNQLDTKMFPLPSFSLTPKVLLRDIPNIPPNTQAMKTNMVAHIRPFLPPAFDTASSQDRFHPSVAGTIDLPTVTQANFNQVRERVASLEKDRSSRPGDDVTVITLGTGSARPTKDRNVLSNLVRIPGWGSILLDSGEGTWGQLMRQFGPEEVHEVLRDIRCIFVSHVHADHHLGTATILAERRRLDPAPTNPLYLVSIRAVHLYLRELSNLQDMGLNDDPSLNGVVSVLSEAVHWRQASAYPTSGRWMVGGDEAWLDMARSREANKEMCKSLGLTSFRTVDMWHRTRCFGAHFKHQDGWSITFSADTLPCDQLVYAGQGSTLLIHEASMADDQADLAEKKAHSTTGQAMHIGKRMKAENILLTHFSARYPRTPPSTIIDPNEAPVGLAFDHASMRIGDIWKLNSYLPALEQSFVETKEEGEDDDEALELSAINQPNLL